MTVVTIHKAKTELSKLIARAEAGEEVIIARGKTPVAELKPLASGKQVKPRPHLGPGSLAHLRGKIPRNLFLEPMPEEELRLWEGAED